MCTVCALQSQTRSARSLNNLPYAANTSLCREASASEDKAFVLTANRDSDVGATAAAAVASALSQAWHRSAERPAGDDDSSCDGSSTSIQPYLSPRQAFQIMVRLGAKKSVHTLSDPSLRHHVRRLTAVQVLPSAWVFDNVGTGYAQACHGLVNSSVYGSIVRMYTLNHRCFMQK